MPQQAEVGIVKIGVVEAETEMISAVEAETERTGAVESEIGTVARTDVINAKVKEIDGAGIAA